MSNGPRGMVCREAVRHMHKVLDARETAGARDGLTAHLAVCEACRTQYERLASVPGALLLDGAPELTSAAWQRVSAGMQTQLTHTRRLRPAHLLRAGVLIVLCLGVALVFLTPERESVSALAGVLDAMDEVETAHGKGIHTVAYWAEGDGLREREEPLETWFASGRGLRRETPTWVVLREPDATVRYNKTQAAAAIETGSDTYGDSFMGRVLSTLYLSPDPRQPKRHVTEGKADLHGRAVDYVEISRDSFGRQWSRWWVDPKSKLILRIEAGDEPDPKPTYRMDYDYNVDVPDAMLLFRPPPGVKVTDLRSVPRQAAHRAADELPNHTITARRPVREGEPYEFGRVDVTEIWSHGTLGARQEYSLGKLVTVSTQDGSWTADHESEGMRSVPFKLFPFIRLAARGVTTFEGLHCDEVELVRRQSEGDEVIEVSYVADEPSAAEMHSGHPAPLGRPWPIKTVTTFSDARERVIEVRKYMRDGDSWQWTETTVVNYPESLPDDVFQFERHWSRPKDPVWYPERRQECIDRLAEE